MTAADRLGRLEGQVLAISQRLAAVGVLGMLGIGVLTALDVLVLRAIFRSPIIGSNEFLSTFFAVAIAAVLASGLAQRATLEIDILKERLPATFVAWLRAFGAALYLVVLVVVAWTVIGHAISAWQQQSATMLLQWRLWPFYGAIALFFVLCIPPQLLASARLASELPSASGEPRAILPITVLMIALAAGVAWLGWLAIAAAGGFIAGHSIAWSIGVFLLLWVLVLFFIPIAAALIICGVLGISGLMGGSTALTVLGSETVGLITNTDLAVLPLFLMMGGFAVAGGMATDIYRLAYALMAPFRGGLALATIGGCAGFGALTGSSMATVGTIGSAAMPEMLSRGYAASLATGCITAGGTLGQLIPPSTVIVIYALLVEESIGLLYMALLVPAALTVLLYMAVILLWVWRDGSIAPHRSDWNLQEILAASRDCVPAALLFVAVIGGMFTGVFTATEAASVGAVIAFLVALLRGKLRRGALWQVIGETTRSTSMLYFVIIGAMVVTFSMGTSGLPELLTEALLDSGWPPLAIVSAIALAFIVLGTVMDTVTIMMITAPILASLIVSLGYDPIWWGIMMVVLVEIGVITPPFGMNLFVIKAMAPDVPLGTVFRGVAPFVAADLVKVVILLLFPAITMWLPSRMGL